MKRESFQGVLLGIVIMCAVFAFITVAWAGLSSTLSISGTATVAAQSWKIGFGTANNAILAEATTLAPAASSAAPGSSPSISKTSFGLTTGSNPTSQAIANFSAPGESVEYTWYTVNQGTFAAKATASQNILASNTAAGSNVGLSCTSADTEKLSNDNAQAFCNNYIKALLTINGNTYHSGDFTESSTITLAKPSGTPTPTPTYHTNVLTIEYLDTIPDSALPAAQVNIALANTITITYSQA